MDRDPKHLGELGLRILIGIILGLLIANVLYWRNPNTNWDWTNPLRQVDR